MKVKLIDYKQEQLDFNETTNSEYVERILDKLPSKGPFTVTLEHDNTSLMCISIDQGLFTLFVQLGDDEFYNYISSIGTQGDIEFVEGGQKVKFDRWYLASRSAVSEAVKNFALNPNWARADSNWRRQT